MFTALTKLFICSQKHRNALQKILDYEQNKETMNKFEHKKIYQKDIHKNRWIFIYPKVNKSDRKSDFLNKFSVLSLSFNSMKQEGKTISSQR